MKLDEMKVQYERSRDGFSSETNFSVSDESKRVKVDASGIVIKISLCAAVLALAIVVRAFGVGKPNDTVAETSTHSDSDLQDQQEQALGALKYVEASTSGKWKAPVLSNDIELLRDGQLLRFTALSDTVNACMGGKVLSVEQDDQLGSLVRIQSDTDCETIYYGFDTVSVRQGIEVRAGETLGTVISGKSIYMRVLIKGAPQDPTDYVDLSLQNQ